MLYSYQHFPFIFKIPFPFLLLKYTFIVLITGEHLVSQQQYWLNFYSLIKVLTFHPEAVWKESKSSTGFLDWFTYTIKNKWKHLESNLKSALYKMPRDPCWQLLLILMEVIRYFFSRRWRENFLLICKASGKWMILFSVTLLEMCIRCDYELYKGDFKNLFSEDSMES